MAQIARFGTLVRRKAKRLRRSDSGATIIEFGLLAVPFFAVLGAIFEIGLYLFAGQLLDTALDDASRSILVGDATRLSYTASDFRKRMCTKTVGLLDCAKIKLRIRPIVSFASANTTPPVDKDGNWILVEQFNSGSSRQVMLVEAYYKWKTFFSFDYGFTKYGNTAMLSSARVFMNEPF